MEPPDEEYPAWVYELAYLNADELTLLSAEEDLDDRPSTDRGSRTRYVSVVFHQGDDATETLNILEQHGPQAAVAHLAQWDFGHETDYAAEANGHVYDEVPSSPGDRTFSDGDYVMTYNKAYGYAGLVRKDETTLPDTEASPGHRPRPLHHRERRDTGRRDSPWTRPGAGSQKQGSMRDHRSRGL